MSIILRVTKSSLTRYSVGLLLSASALLLLWPGLARNLFAVERDDGVYFMPHAHCYLMVPSLVALHAVNDFLIGLSYVAISLTLAYLIHRTRRDIPFSWVFIAFGLFIIACGMTHFMEVLTLNYPAYWLSGYVKLVTAAASLATAVVLPPLIPKTISLVQTAKAAEEHRRELERAHAELEVLYARVKEADELKTRFFANVSHELRTPLALILGPVEKLRAAENLSAEQQRALEVAGLHARGLLRQVNDLLDISKLEAGRMGVQYAEIDLTRLLRLTASHFESLAMERGVEFRVETPEAPVTAEADPDKLQRILLNLFANAFKFTPAAGGVRCRLRTEGDGRAAVIEVEDTGPGVAPESRERIFERYDQGQEDVSRRFGGTGLGLAIAREFVELHGGTISVDDAPSGGAVFRVRIPLNAPKGSRLSPFEEDEEDTGELARQAVNELRASGPADERGARARAAEVKPAREVAGPHAPAGDPAREAGPLVLVVEDNAEMNRFITDALGDEYRVESAFDGNEGLEKAAALRPDLILSDVMMPRLSGDRMVREIRRRGELDDVPVLMLTAKADDDLRVSLLREGAQDYLMKPFSVEELRARVGQQVSVKRARDLLRQELASRGRSLEEMVGELTARKRELEAALEALKRSEAGRAEALARETTARRAAEEASRLKDEFLATVSHELRLPLTPIVGWSQMLLSNTFEPQVARNALETIARCARSQQRIINDLLDVSRIITGKLRIDARPVRLAPVIEAAAESLRPAAEAKGIRLALELDGEAGEVSGDAERLQQVFWNLLSNAVKFTPTGGRVHIRLAGAGDSLEVAVSDTGEGIAPEFLPHVFDRFRQADGSTTREHGGLGLGLAIVRHLVELHGGTARAVSAGEGQGATFTVRLPRLRNADFGLRNDERGGVVAGDQPATRNPQSAILSGLRLLVVDDEQDAREVIAAMLVQGGAQVETAASVAEAVGALQTFRPDALVSDIEMPGEDGYELIRRVRSEGEGARAELPALALTAHTRPEDRERILAAGFHLHLAKPVSQDELVAGVAMLTGRESQR